MAGSACRDKSLLRENEFDVKLLRYSFSEAIPIFSIVFKVVFSLCDRYKNFDQ